MQAMAVLLLELSHGPVPLTVATPNIATCVDKLTTWLQSMMAHDTVSLRAYQIVCRIRRKIERRTGVKIPDHFASIQAMQKDRNMDSSESYRPRFPPVPLYPDSQSFPTSTYPCAQPQPPLRPQEPRPSPMPHLAFRPPNFESQGANVDMAFLHQPLMEPEMNFESSQDQLPIFHETTFTTDYDQFLSQGFGDFGNWTRQNSEWQ